MPAMSPGQTRAGQAGGDAVLDHGWIASLPRILRRPLIRGWRRIEITPPMRAGRGSALALGFVGSFWLAGLLVGGHGPSVLSAVGDAAGLKTVDIVVSGHAETQENDVVAVQDKAAGEETFAATNANGTGAFKVDSRVPDDKTILVQNEAYWGMEDFPMEVTRIEFTPIQNAATRVAALLSGEVDFIQDVPVQDLARVDQAEGLKVVNAPQNRTIFFGMNVADDDLESDNVDGKNPFAEQKVREAINMALDRNAIQQVVMRGQSDPTGVIIPPFVNGWTEELNAPPEGDMEAAKALMEEAGYGDGFEVTLNCPNDRYINDEAICQAFVGMLSQIGVTANLVAQTKANHFPLIQNRETDFYMLGWGVPTFDSEYVFNFLVHSQTEDRGSWNGARYSNPEVDAMIQSLSSEVDEGARNETIAKLWEVVNGETIYIPVHNQILNWGMSEGIEFPVQPEDQPHFKFLTYAGS